LIFNIALFSGVGGFELQELKLVLGDSTVD